MKRIDSETFFLPGPAGLRRHFFPRQRLRITEVSSIVGLSRDRLYKRIKQGRLNLTIQFDEAGRPFVTLDALIDYLYPSASPFTSPSPASPPAKRGRPRKSTEGGAI